MENSIEENLNFLYIKAVNENRLKDWIEKFKNKITKNPETGREVKYETILKNPDHPLHQKIANSYEEKKQEIKNDKGEGSGSEKSVKEKIEDLREEIKGIENLFDTKIDSLQDKFKTTSERTDQVCNSVLLKGLAEKERYKSKIEFSQKILDYIEDQEKKREIKDHIEEYKKNMDTIEKSMNKAEEEAEEKYGDDPEFQKAKESYDDAEEVEVEEPDENPEPENVESEPESEPERVNLMSSSDSEESDVKKEDERQQFEEGEIKKKIEAVSASLKKEEDELSKETDESKKEEKRNLIDNIKDNLKELESALQQVKNNTSESSNTGWWTLNAMYSIIEQQLRDLEDKLI